MRIAKWQRDLIEVTLDLRRPSPKMKQVLNEALRHTGHELKQPASFREGYGSIDLVG